MKSERLKHNYVCNLSKRLFLQLMGEILYVVHSSSRRSHRLNLLPRTKASIVGTSDLARKKSDYVVRLSLKIDFCSTEAVVLFY